MSTAGLFRYCSYRNRLGRGLLLFDVHDFVKRRALSGQESGVKDKLLAFFNVRLVDEIRGRVHVLFKESSAKIVSPEMKRNLSDLLSFGELRGLDVRKVVQVDSRERNHLQVARWSSVVWNYFFERRVPGLK